MPRRCESEIRFSARPAPIVQATKSRWIVGADEPRRLDNGPPHFPKITTRVFYEIHQALESRPRRILRDALEAKASAVDDMAVAQTRIDRLQSVIAAVELARAKLAAHDADQAQRLAAWASFDRWRRSAES